MRERPPCLPHSPATCTWAPCQLLYSEIRSWKLLLISVAPLQLSKLDLCTLQSLQLHTAVEIGVDSFTQTRLVLGRTCQRKPRGSACQGAPPEESLYVRGVETGEQKRLPACLVPLGCSRYPASTCCRCKPDLTDHIAELTRKSSSLAGLQLYSL